MFVRESTGRLLFENNEKVLSTLRHPEYHRLLQTTLQSSVGRLGRYGFGIKVKRPQKNVPSKIFQALSNQS